MIESSIERFPLRFEMKYILDLTTYFDIKKAILGRVREDNYSAIASDKKYLVRSLYYDTHHYQAYFEKITGEKNRIKLRVRSYWPTKSEVKFVNIELKTRLGVQIKKLHTQTSFENYLHFVQFNSWEDHSEPVLEEFERITRLLILRPVLLVDYFREAYVSKADSDVRITFDHNIKYSETNSLFPRSCIWRSNNPHDIVLEIKTQGELPPWLHNIIIENSLYSAPNSKYAIGVENTQNSIYRFMH